MELRKNNRPEGENLGNLAIAPYKWTPEKPDVRRAREKEDTSSIVEELMEEEPAEEDDAWQVTQPPSYRGRNVGKETEDGSEFMEVMTD